MVQIHPHRDVEKMLDYHRDHLAADTAAADYYGQGGQSVGMWCGKTAAMLGLSGVVNEHDLGQVSKNLHPETGEQLTPRRRADAIPAYDLCVSVFKSASVMGLGLDMIPIVDIMRAAAAETIKEVELLAAVRVRKGGKNLDEDRVTGNIAAAVFEHFSSRANDPQWHMHVLLPNVSWDEVEGRFKALQARGLYRGSGMLTEVFRTTIQRMLREIGCETVRTKNGVEIVGVSSAIIKKFSKRHEEIDKAAAALGGLNNKKLRKTIAHNSRAKKTLRTLDALRADWLGQLTPEQIAELEAVKASATGPLPSTSTVTADEALEWSARHHLERLSVVPKCKLFRQALAYGNGYLTLDDIRAALAKNASGQFMVDGENVTTREMFAAEQTMVAFVDGGKNACQSLNPGFIYTGDKVSAEQSAAVSLLLDSRDLVTSLHGPAGAGKTTTLKGLRLGLEAVGCNVVFCAPTAKATDKLRSDGFADAVTLQRLLTSTTLRAQLAGSVVVLDEAGVASVPQMNALFELSDKANGLRFILAGDSFQHKAVQSGDALRILERECEGMTRAELATIHRQKDEAYKAAVTLLKDGDSEGGFRALDKLGWVKEYDHDERYERLAEEYLETRIAGDSCLTVCATWREANLATDSIRATLKAAGKLSLADHQLTALAPSNMTDPERGHVRCYEPGNVIVFRRKTLLFKRNERLTVLGFEDGVLRVQNAKGQTLCFDPAKDCECFGVFEPRPIAVAKGDELLLRANGWAAPEAGAARKPLTNGELVTVDRVFKSGSIALKDGRVIPANYGQFAHGYAITTQSSQSQSVKVVLMAIDAESAHGGTSQETLYVGASRGEERCSIYTDVKAEVATAFMRSGQRMSAHEFVERQKANQQNNTPHEKTKPTGTPGTHPSQPIPATRPLAHSTRFNPPGVRQIQGGGTPPVLRPEPVHSQSGNQPPRVSEQSAFHGLSGTRSELPDSPVCYPHYEGPETNLGR